MNLPAALRRRRTHAGPGQRPAAPADRLVSTAQRRLAITTLALLVALLVVVGATTALLGQRSLDASVDRTLETAAVAELSRLHEATGPTGSAAPGESGGGGEQESEQTPAASHTAPGTQTAATLATDADDHAPAAADTFFLYLDASGAVVANPERVALAGLPDRDAAVAASLRGRDLRTVRVGDVRLRLLSLAVPAEDGAGANIRTLQAGFVLTLHDEQSDTLLRSILVVGLGGLLGAAFVSVSSPVARWCPSGRRSSVSGASSRRLPMSCERRSR